MTAHFDTLSIARNLRDHGFSQEQAEAITDAVKTASGFPDISQLSTKSDLAVAVETLRREIASSSAAIEARLSAAIFDSFKWVVGVIVASISVNIGAMIAIVKFFGHSP